MCTVLYIPKAGRQIFASLRDESPKRPKALAPMVYGLSPSCYIAPLDSLAGGTWIGATEDGNVIILLNGGFHNHERQVKYAKSRGLIVTELLGETLPVVSWCLMDLEGIEPFSLVVWSEQLLFHLVWDGVEKHRLLLDPHIPHIWSSSTLYDAAAKARRKAQFEAWITRATSMDKHALLAFFKANSDTENGFLVNRAEQIKTLSYSYLEYEHHESLRYSYCDFQSNIFINQRLELIDTSQLCLLP